MTTQRHSQQLHRFGGRPGYSSLIAVLVTSAVGVTIVAAITFVSIGSLKTGRTAELSVQARGYADACAEEAIWQLREDDTYAAGAALLFPPSGSCGVTTITGTGQTNRTVTTTGVSSGVTRQVQVTIANLAAPISITQWEEI